MKRSWPFALIMLLGIVLSLGAYVPHVHADAPTRETLPFKTVDLPAGEFCAFAVHIEPLSNKEKLTTFYDSEGNERISVVTGALKVRVTNLATGKSVTLSVSGPIRVQPQPNDALRVTYLGPGLLWFSPPVGGLPSLAFVHGQIVTELDADDNVRVVSQRGKVENLCVTLAST